MASASNKSKKIVTNSIKKEPFTAKKEAVAATVNITQSFDVRWDQQGVTVAGGQDQGQENDELKLPVGIYVDDDDDQTIVVTDYGNERIVQCQRGNTEGQIIVANDPDSESSRLDRPVNVLIDKASNSLIIADDGKRQVLRWPRSPGASNGEVLIENIDCYGLAIDEQGNLYVSDIKRQEVRRYEIARNDKKGTLVAGGKGKGTRLDQFNEPQYIFVDAQQNLFVSDCYNHRVVRWNKGATRGIVVAPGQGADGILGHLSYPQGIFVDAFETVYVAESGNNRVTCWPKGAKQGIIVAGGNHLGKGPNQFNVVHGLSFDKYENLYVVDYYNHRVQRFNRIPPLNQHQSPPLTRNINTTNNSNSTETPDVNVTTSTKRVIPNLPIDAQWKQNSVTIAGGLGWGEGNNHLRDCLGIFLDDDDDQTIVIADQDNHRIVQCRKGKKSGQIVAGGNGQGNRLDQLFNPSDVLIDKGTNSLIIADRQNQRVVRWSRSNGTTQGEILIDNIKCFGLAMDEQRNLYVSDTRKHEVLRFEIDREDKIGITVAGGNGDGIALNKLSYPRYIFVDQQQNLYVSDYNNHRVMKWVKDTTQGIVVAGGQGKGEPLTKLWYPTGIFVDLHGNVYVAEEKNRRVTRWSEGAKEGIVVVNGKGSESVEFDSPEGIAVDKYGHLYIADRANHLVQRYTRL